MVRKYSWIEISGIHRSEPGKEKARINRDLREFKVSESN
jgi:hypothetical protein